MKKVDWEKAKPLWGAATDKVIAETLGIRREAVCRHRSKHGIPSVHGESRG
jgi:hypothetical protein